MALIKTSNEIVSIRGRFGGVYFKTGKDGKHVQAMPRVWNYTRSPAQMGGWGGDSPFMSTGISGYSGASAFWLLALLAFYAGYWAIFGLTYFFSDEDGRKKRITGYNWYIHYALAFPEEQRPPFWKPPHAPKELPNYIVTYRGTWIYDHAPPQWPTDCPSGYYWFFLPYNDKPAYKNDTFQWYLWWKDPVWVLSKDMAFETPGFTFYSDGADINDYYYNPVTKKRAHVYFGSPEERENPP